jgi:hypothetical protein
MVVGKMENCIAHLETFQVQKKKLRISELNRRDDAEYQKYGVIAPRKERTGANGVRVDN